MASTDESNARRFASVRVISARNNNAIVHALHTLEIPKMTPDKVGIVADLKRQLRISHFPSKDDVEYAFGPPIGDGGAEEGRVHLS